jgi:hypothetical protein
MPGVNVSGSIIDDPEFTDMLNGDFSLRMGSPAIGAGFPIQEPTTDYSGAPYSLTTRSVGAFEFQASGVSIPSTISEFTISPNPCGNVLTLFCNTTPPPSEIIVLDVLGRDVERIRSLSFDAESISINPDGLMDGEYTLLARASNGDLIGHRSFVKMRW